MPNDITPNTPFKTQRNTQSNTQSAAQSSTKVSTKVSTKLAEELSSNAQSNASKSVMQELTQEKKTKAVQKQPDALTLEKEKVAQLSFESNDVLAENSLIRKRKIDLQRAQALGAQSKSNIKIYFKDALQVKYLVEATVWAATEKNVTLKGGVLIPNRAIYKIGFF
jgi:hypothetical protein